MKDRSIIVSCPIMIYPSSLHVASYSRSKISKIAIVYTTQKYVPSQANSVKIIVVMVCLVHHGKEADAA